MTVEQILTWAYRDQQVHRYLRRELDWYLWALDDAGLAGDWHDRRPVHHDAAEVHAAVMALAETEGDELAHIVFEFAALGDRPERCTTSPRAVPVPPMSRSQDYGWYEVDGERRDYLVLTAEVLRVETAVYERIGRKRMRAAAPTTTRYQVKYCPIDWVPNDAFIAMTHHVADQWERAIALLRKALAGAKLRSHVIVAAPDDDPDGAMISLDSEACV